MLWAVLLRGLSTLHAAIGCGIAVRFVGACVLGTRKQTVK